MSTSANQEGQGPATQMSHGPCEKLTTSGAARHPVPGSGGRRQNAGTILDFGTGGYDWDRERERHFTTHNHFTDSSNSTLDDSLV